MKNNPRKIEEIIVHCSDTPAGKYFDAKDINKWHLARGWQGIGYHYVILLDGTIEKGRKEDKKGAHTLDHNTKSIGICYIGGMATDTRTTEQKISLLYLIGRIKRDYGPIKVYGHNDFSIKACPQFNAQKEYAGNRIRLAVKFFLLHLKFKTLLI